jgi:hypothetical protein
VKTGPTFLMDKINSERYVRLIFNTILHTAYREGKKIVWIISAGFNNFHKTVAL